MTALVGICCTDGIVIGSDSSSTFAATHQFRTIEQKCKKVDTIDDQMILAGTGAVGLHQRFREVVTAYWRQPKPVTEPKVAKTALEMARELSNRGHGDFQ